MSEIEDLKKKVVLACRMLFYKELVDYSGHISVRIAGTDRFLINPHPISRAAVTPEDILTADLTGKLVEGKWNLPSELPMHTRTYLAREDVQSVAHLHNRMVVVLSMAGCELAPSSNVGAFFGPGVIPVYQDPALIHSNEQGDEVARTLGAGEVAILRGHGSVVVGNSIEWSFTGCVDLEESATRHYHASLLGPVRCYTDDETNRVAKVRRRQPIVQKVWDHYVAKTRMAGLLDGI